MQLQLAINYFRGARRSTRALGAWLCTIYACDAVYLCLCYIHERIYSSYIAWLYIHRSLQVESAVDSFIQLTKFD